MTVEWGTRVPRMGPAGNVLQVVAWRPVRHRGTTVDAALHFYVGRGVAPGDGG